MNTSKYISLCIVHYDVIALKCDHFSQIVFFTLSSGCLYLFNEFDGGISETHLTHYYCLLCHIKSSVNMNE